MLKSIVSVCLILSILLQTLVGVVIIFTYEINKENITKLFCENKSKPELSCNGQCHLKKQLKKAEKEQGNPNIKIVKEVTLFIEQSIGYNFFTHETLSNSFDRQAFYTSNYLSFIFHPPPVI